MNYQITQLHVYPIKSLGGIALSKATLSPRGILHDRRWMLTTPNGHFITQRTHPTLAQFRLQFQPNGLLVQHPNANTSILVPFELPPHRPIIDVIIFKDNCEATVAAEEINEWFSRVIGEEVLLVYQHDQSIRPLKNHPGYEVSFSDGQQFLFIGEASLAQLNTRFEAPFPMNRFRPNIVFSGGSPHVEDHWRHIKIQEAELEYTKLCGRCKVVTIDQSTAIVGKEPLRTLATYRTEGKKVFFGSQFKWLSSTYNTIAVGDQIEVLSEILPTAPDQ